MRETYRPQPYTNNPPELYTDGISKDNFRGIGWQWLGQRFIFDKDGFTVFYVPQSKYRPEEPTIKSRSISEPEAANFLSQVAKKVQLFANIGDPLLVQYQEMYTKMQERYAQDFPKPAPTSS